VVLTTRVLVAPELVGVTDGGLKEQETPVGSDGPIVLQERLTGWAKPASRVAVIMLEPEAPWETVTPLEWSMPKSQDTVTAVNCIC
jgi:hypothetical protein